MRNPTGLEDKAVVEVLKVLKDVQPASYYRIDRSCVRAGFSEILPMAGVKLAQENGLVDLAIDGYVLTSDGEKYITEFS